MSQDTVIVTDNYTYDGDIVDGVAHGNGVYYYKNGDQYTGEVKYNKLDGFGTYNYRSGARYVGFFSYGKIHGIGTFEDSYHIYKGTWRNSKRHGIFYKTAKQSQATFLQQWQNDKLIKSSRTQYLSPDTLVTTKSNPRNKPKKKQVEFKHDPTKTKLCVACCINPMNSTVTLCGHVSMCYDCLSKCDRCPICRAEITNRLQVIKLYIS